MARIDDRLIHGQVVLGCCEPLRAARLLLIDDAVASDPMQTRIYKSAVPPEIECRILGVQEGAEFVRDCHDGEATVLVVGSPRDMARLLQLGAQIDEVCLGGLHRCDSRVEELDGSGVFVGSEDRAALLEIRSSGVRVSVQAVAGAPAADLDALLRLDEP